MPIDADASDVAIKQIIPPERPPMNNAKGGPTVDVECDQIDILSINDQSVQSDE